MQSADGRYVITYNGEIYNFPEMKTQLEARGVVFRTTSDTEALPPLYALDGPDMLRALKQAGWERYSLFARPDGLIVGYVEADDLDAAQRAMAMTDANTRWQHEMQRFFVSVDGQAPGGTLVLLEPIFNLDDQLAAADRDPASSRDG